MTKEEVLKQIDELKKFVEDCDKVEPNIVTKLPTKDNSDGDINGEWAFSIEQTEQDGEITRGATKSGHKASLFLADCFGTWFTEDGTEIKGYLYYKPKIW